MKTDRQTYVDGSIQIALNRGFDTLQLKFDGWWCRLVVENGTFSMYSRASDKYPDGRLLKTGSAAPGFSGVFIGEYMFGTNWAQDPTRREKLFLFDAWKVGPVDLGLASYRDRFGALKAQQNYFPDWMSVVQVWHIGEFERIWREEVETFRFEGVVFRKRVDDVGGFIIRQKRQATIDLIVLGFEEGEGKHAGRLGALLCGTKEKPTEAFARVGNGFSDSEREEIWSRPDLFKGKWLEAQGAGVFLSTGLLRHPTFLRWRTEDGI